MATIYVLTSTLPPFHKFTTSEFLEQFEINKSLPVHTQIVDVTQSIEFIFKNTQYTTFYRISIYDNGEINIKCKTINSKTQTPVVEFTDTGRIDLKHNYKEQAVSKFKNTVLKSLSKKYISLLTENTKYFG